MLSDVALEKHALSYLLQEENQNYPLGVGLLGQCVDVYAVQPDVAQIPLLGTLPKIFQQKYRRAWA